MSRSAIRAHGFANAVAHEPRGLESDAKGAVELVRADALLAARHQVEGLQPEVQRNVALLEDGADGHPELAAAGIALVEAEAGGLALEPGDAMPGAAVWAHGAVRPDLGFYPGVGGLFVL